LKLIMAVSRRKLIKYVSFFIDIGKNDTYITEAENFCSTLYDHKTMFLYPTTVKEVNMILEKI